MKKAAILLALIFLAGCSLTNKKAVPLGEKKGTPAHTPSRQYDGWTIARGSMHNHTIYSDGCRTMDDLVQEARNEGLAVLGITDHREGRQCLGKHEKFCIQTGGVESKNEGYEKYMNDLRRVAAESKSPVIIPGLEVVPYVWNERRFPFAVLRGSSWHFTVYNIDDQAVYEKMPAFRMVTIKGFMEPMVDPFNNIAPFDKWVKYMREHGAIVAQAHPQWLGNGWTLTVRAESPYPLFMTDQMPELNLVALLPEGFNAGAAGGKWDQGLMQYLAGFRDQPFWAWGEADYHCQNKAGDSPGLRMGTTLFYLTDLSHDGVIDAIKRGRMVGLMGNEFQEVYVSEFSVGNGKPSGKKIMLGEEVKLDAAPVVRFSLSSDLPVAQVSLIRNGRVIHTSKSTSFEYTDKVAGEKKLRCYYRVEVVGQGPVEIANANLLFTNPVFVSWK